MNVAYLYHNIVDAAQHYENGSHAAYSGTHFESGSPWSNTIGYDRRELFDCQTGPSLLALYFEHSTSAYKSGLLHITVR